LGSAQPGCPSPDGADRHLHSNSDGHAPTIANFTRTDSGVADTHEYAHPGTIAHAPTIANFTRTDSGVADTHEYAHPGTIAHAPTIADPAGSDRGTADTHEYAHPGIIGHVPTIANPAGSDSDTHGYATTTLPYSHGHADGHAQPNGPCHRHSDDLSNRHAFTQPHHDTNHAFSTYGDGDSDSGTNAPGGQGSLWLEPLGCCWSLARDRGYGNAFSKAQNEGIMRRLSDFFTVRNVLAATMLLIGVFLIITNLGAMMQPPAGTSQGQGREETNQQIHQVERLRTPTSKATPTVVERLIPSHPPTPVLSTGASPLTTSVSLPPSALPKPTEGSIPTHTEGMPAEVIPSIPSKEAQASLFLTRERFGVGVALPPIDQYDVGRLGVGWYVDWWVHPDPPHPNDVEFVQMIRVSGGSYAPGTETIGAAADTNPGSLWMIGNEPDVIWQDNATPVEYAQVYHELYTLLKARDPSCQVAIGGISQPTPLRLRYLDMILEAYERLYGQKMPVDVWNTHAFILREERDSWGVDIPPGISEATGILYEIENHGDLDIFKQQIVDFRRWMKERGEREKPLIVSEYGILMPEDYGFTYEAVRDFMYESFDYFLAAIDDNLGYPADGNRLVQRWAWYSLSDTRYPTGNLFDPETKEITPLGIDYQNYVEGILSP
jgi:hypothetical protein